MRILGISALGHDAAISVVDDEQISFAAHAERYSRRKNDPDLNLALLNDALRDAPPDVICWYERPWLKKARQIIARQWHELGTVSPAQHLSQFGLGHIPIHYYGHHRCHAAAGYYTSPFTDACVVVVDAIGEFTTISIWDAHDGTLRRIWAQRYPDSIGLLYSAMTQRCGLTPNEEEYIVMGMAAFGQPRYVDAIRHDFIRPTPPPAFRLTRNVHRGIRSWQSDITACDLAASIQAITEKYLVGLMTAARILTRRDNLVFMGGVALNCVANTKIALQCGYKDIWIMPNPGDAGSSLGAILAHRGKPLVWTSAFLGHAIDRPLDVGGIVDALEAGEVVGVANGRAEFGPRALGHRSLLADPRGGATKDKVNRIKKRELFRPFAPAILADLADRYFDMPVHRSPYMQFTAPCRMPEQFPAICHIDGSSRVQTVDSGSLHTILAAWFKRTGCPMLLNTSLNIKGEPLVNSWEDAQRFANMYDVTVF